MADVSMTERPADLTPKAQRLTTFKELHDFVSQVAGFIAESDPVDGEEYVMENDDAWETVNGLIHEARGILGLPEVLEH